MTPRGLDLSNTPTAHLRAILTLPTVHERYQQLVRAELARRPQDSKRHTGKQPRLSVTPNDTGLIVVLTPEPPSANDLKRWLYNARGKHKYGAYRDAVMRLFLQANLPMRFEQPLTVTHSWRLPFAVRDEDSFGFSLKPVLDAMVNAGVLADDRLVALRFGGQIAGGPGASTDRGLTLHMELHA